MFGGLASSPLSAEDEAQPAVLALSAHGASLLATISAPSAAFPSASTGLATRHAVLGGGEHLALDAERLRAAWPHVCFTFATEYDFEAFARLAAEAERAFTARMLQETLERDLGVPVEGLAPFAPRASGGTSSSQAEAERALVGRLALRPPLLRLVVAHPPPPVAPVMPPPPPPKPRPQASASVPSSSVPAAAATRNKRPREEAVPTRGAASAVAAAAGSARPAPRLEAEAPR